MANSHPISPPPLIAAGVPPSTSSADPISPVSRSGTFLHKTSPAVSTQTPLIDTSTPAINDAPVELDGWSISPEELRRRNTGEGGGVVIGGSGGIGGSGSGVDMSGGVGSSLRSPDDEADAEFLGEGENLGREAREKRAAMLASRSKDPSVIVDVPQDPTAEEVEAARKADALLLPGMREGLSEGS